MTPEGLLEAAEALVPPGRGRPSRARIRRSISTAYYALFTAFTAEVARPYRRNVKTTARRLVEHGKARSVCDTLKGNNRADPNLRDRQPRPRGGAPAYLHAAGELAAADGEERQQVGALAQLGEVPGAGAHVVGGVAAAAAGTAVGAAAVVGQAVMEADAAGA